MFRERRDARRAGPDVSRGATGRCRPPAAVRVARRARPGRSSRSRRGPRAWARVARGRVRRPSAGRACCATLRRAPRVARGRPTPRALLRRADLVGVSHHDVAGHELATWPVSFRHPARDLLVTGGPRRRAARPSRCGDGPHRGPALPADRDRPRGRPDRRRRHVPGRAACRRSSRPAGRRGGRRPPSASPRPPVRSRSRASGWTGSRHTGAGPGPAGPGAGPAGGRPERGRPGRVARAWRRRARPARSASSAAPAGRAGGGAFDRLQPPSGSLERRLRSRQPVLAQLGELDPGDEGGAARSGSQPRPGHPPPLQATPAGGAGARGPCRCAGSQGADTATRRSGPARPCAAGLGRPPKSGRAGRPPWHQSRSRRSRRRTAGGSAREGATESIWSSATSRQASASSGRWSRAKDRARPGEVPGWRGATGSRSA